MRRPERRRGLQKFRRCFFFFFFLSSGWGPPQCTPVIEANTEILGLLTALTQLRLLCCCVCAWVIRSVWASRCHQSSTTAADRPLSMIAPTPTSTPALSVGWGGARPAGLGPLAMTIRWKQRRSLGLSSPPAHPSHLHLKIPALQRGSEEQTQLEVFEPFIKQREEKRCCHYCKKSPHIQGGF